MKYEIITIFPEFFDSVFSCGILSKAREKGLVEITFRNPRDFAEDRRRTVDDRPYGGGEGMVMLAPPLGEAIEAAKAGSEKTLTVLTSASGVPFTAGLARKFCEFEKIVIVCGRYEGIDERVRLLHADMEISIGDYIISGGEYAAAVITDAVSRLVAGVVGCGASTENESLSDGLVGCPQYTRPENYKGLRVPDVLLSGNHGMIEQWRKNQRIRSTFFKRPEILGRARLSKKQTQALAELQKNQTPNHRAYVVLLHYPVYNRRFEKVASAFTSLDIHDIARTCRTYGVRKFFAANPVPEQRELAGRVLKYWTGGPGAEFNSTRREALELAQITAGLADAAREIERIEGEAPAVVATDARFGENMVGYEELREKIMSARLPFLIVFGTGWGLAREVTDSADYVLKPLKGTGDYNHLSVRSAAAAIMDRLFSVRI